MKKLISYKKFYESHIVEENIQLLYELYDIFIRIEDEFGTDIKLRLYQDRRHFTLHYGDLETNKWRFLPTNYISIFGELRGLDPEKLLDYIKLVNESITTSENMLGVKLFTQKLQAGISSSIIKNKELSKSFRIISPHINNWVRSSDVDEENLNLGDYLEEFQKGGSIYMTIHINFQIPELEFQK